MRLALAAALEVAKGRILLPCLGLTLLLPFPVTAHHEDAEAVVFAEFLTRLDDTTQNPTETVIIGHESAWSCSLRQLYFDLLLYAGRFWPTLPAQSAAATARGLADLHADFCEPTLA